MAFMILLIYIAAIYIRPQEWIFAVYGWPIIDILVLLSVFFLLWELMRRKKITLNEPQSVLLLCFLGSIVLSHVAHTYAWGAWDSFLKFGRNVVMFLLFVNILTSKNRLRVTIWAIIILSVILAIQGIYQYRHGYGWAGQPLILDRGRPRITWVGIFNDPNDLALAFVIAIGFLLSFLFGNTRFSAKIFSIPLMFILVRALYLTNSRGGYLALAATTAFYCLRRIKYKLVAVIIGSLLAFFVIIIGPSRLANLSASEASAYGRIDAWYEGFQMLKSSPLFGVGYGMFTDHYPKTAHNSYILVAAEEGLVGLFIWTALIYCCFKGLRILIKKNEELRPYTLGLEAGLVGLLSASFFLSRSYIVVLYILLALASAFAYTLLKKEEYRLNLRDTGTAGVLSLGILFLTWVSMRVSLRLFG